MGNDDTYLSMFSQPLSEAWDSMIIQVAFAGSNGLCTQSQTLLMGKEMAVTQNRTINHYLNIFECCLFTSMQDREIPCELTMP